jgi:hypothetical protein
MSIFIGKIESIEEENIGTVHHKKVVTLKKDSETAFFEFRKATFIKFLEAFKKGDSVMVGYLHQGKQTTAKMRFNNLVAQTIEKI